MCTEYSQALTTRERNFPMADGRVQAALKCIAHLQPTYWFIENPVGHLHTRPLMQPHAEYLYETTY